MNSIRLLFIYLVLATSAWSAENRVYRDRVQPHWLPGNNQFWYKVTLGPEAHEFILVDAEKGARQAAFDHGRLAKALGEAGVKEARAERLALDNLEFNLGEEKMQFRCGGGLWLP